MQRTLAILLPAALCALAILACNSPPTQPTAVFPTLAASSTPQPSPTHTSTPPPPTATPTPSPTPTPLPVEQLASAEQALAVGDFDGAVEAGRVLSESVLSGTEAVQAQLVLGTAYLRSQRYLSAADTFQVLLERYPQHDLAPDAHFLLAEALSAAGDPAAAAVEYRAYLEGVAALPDPARRGAVPQVSALLGDALYATGAYTQAAESYAASVAGESVLGQALETREKLALVYVALEQYDQALAQYDAIIAQVGYDAYRARIEYQAAETLLLAGQSEAGYARHLYNVETYPTQYFAYQSLVELVEAGRPFDNNYLRGIVDYYGEAYDPAVQALAAYVREYPSTHNGDAHYWAGRAYLAAGNLAWAENEFQMLIDDHPDADNWGGGWHGLAQTQVAADDVEAAVDTYRAFAEAAPLHTRAPEALWEAARLLRRYGDLSEAAQAHLDVQTAYPGSEYADLSLHQAGVSLYRVGEYTRAITTWQTLVAQYPFSDLQPGALLWIGKSQLALGDAAAAAASFAQAAESDPHGFYGLRAAQLALDPAATPLPPADSPVDYDEGAAQAEADTWMAGWLGLPVEQVRTLQPHLASDARLLAGRELWRLGRFAEAKAEFESLRVATAGDALAQYQLALLYRDLGLYRSSILCASALVQLAPLDHVLDAPAFIGRLAHPIYYRDLVLENAALVDLDPLLVAALIRQESLFEGFITSHASAHGLMQVIPSTGSYIAGQLGWPPGYQTEDLYRPNVSLRFGTWYLSRQRDVFDGNMYVAMSAYNAGPGNAARWVEAVGGEAPLDPDLFYEVITLREPRLYIERIGEQYAVYSALYGSGFQAP